MVDITTFEYNHGYLRLKVVIPIEQYSGLEGCYIKKITLCSPEFYSSSNNWYIVYEQDPDDPEDIITSYPPTSGPIAINSEYVSEDSDMYILRVECGGTPSPDVPCEYQKPVKEVAILYPNHMYNYAISFIKDMQNDCSKTGPFNDFMMRYKAVELAVKSCDIKNAVAYYNMFFGKNRVPNEVTYPYSYDTRGQIISGGCGCGHY